jgi:hypothetical protein
MNAQNSELFFCRGSVEGDQFVAPSIPETAQLEGSFVPCAKAQVIEPENASAATMQPNVNPVAIFNVDWSPGRDFTG